MFRVKAAGDHFYFLLPMSPECGSACGALSTSHQKALLPPPSTLPLDSLDEHRRAAGAGWEVMW